MLSRREFLSSAPVALAAAAPARPNFIIFLADDLGCHDLGCLGARDLKTPNIDALAAGGTRFANWYSNAPVCAPARGALMTGRYPQRNGVATNGVPLKPAEKTIAEVLKPHGYATAAIGKWHLGSTPETVPNAHGFDYFYGFHSGCADYYSHRYYWGEPRRVNYHDLWRNRAEIFEDGQYLTESIAREASRFVEDHHDRPFFLYCAFNAVHYPMHAPNKYVERFPGLDRERQMYAAMLSAADDGVGRVMAALKRHGLTGNTLVFFGGDNGATREPRAGLNQQPARGGSNEPFRGNKFSLFDGGMHVPGMLSWPGRIPAGQVVREIGAHFDLLPTFAKAAGVTLEHAVDGSDILPAAANRAGSPHEALFWASGGQLAVRRGPWKLIRNPRVFDGTPEGNKPLTGDDAIHLSNLQEDPGESRNRRHDNPALADELLTLAEKWLAGVGRP